MTHYIYASLLLVINLYFLFLFERTCCYNEKENVRTDNKRKCYANIKDSDIVKYANIDLKKCN